MSLYPLKLVPLTMLLFWQLGVRGVVPDTQLRYERTVSLPRDAAAGQACATLDAQVFAHAAASLKDLRLYANGATEVPYATTLSEPIEQESEDAAVLNISTPRPDHIAFDLKMPGQPYTAVVLNLNRQNFLATAIVDGELSLGDSQKTRLGSFPIFDLASRQLGRDTTLRLPESTFPYLRIDLAMAVLPGASAVLVSPALLSAATVPPSREAQSLYVTTQRASAFFQRGGQTVAVFEVPVHVPVERISFDLAPGFKGNFSRSVAITAAARPPVARTVGQSEPGKRQADEQAQPDIQSDVQTERLTGTILRVHTALAGHELAEESLSVPVAVGSNMQQAATVEVAIDNGDQPPLPLQAIRLEMRERRLCFDASAGWRPDGLRLEYGNADLAAPAYAYATRFEPSAKPVVALLGTEQFNPYYRPAAEDPDSDAKRDPDRILVLLIAALCVLAMVALRAVRRRSR